MIASIRSPLVGHPLPQCATVISGILALLAGIVAIGYRLFGPLVTVYSYIAPGGDNCPSGCHITQHESHWVLSHGYLGSWLGLALLGICVLALLAIGYGAYIHGTRQAAPGHLLIWVGTAVLALEVVLTEVVVGLQLDPMYLVAPYLLPALGLALFASGAATGQT